MDATSLAQAHLRSNYTDIASLSGQLPKGKAALEAAATQFESVFLDMWLQSMRAAGEVFGEGSYLSSDTTDMHQEMLDHQLAVHLAESGGIGLRDVIIRQLSPPADSIAPVTGELPPRTTSASQAVPAADSDLPPGFKAAGFESMDAFLETVLPMVQQALSALAFNPIGVVAQAALETGWGSRLIHSADGTPSHNLFGIKTHGWEGESVRVPTLEHESGGYVSRNEHFRVYPDWQAAVTDYLDFLQDNPRYHDVLNVAEDPHKFADGLQTAGYATDPDYAQKIKQIVDQLYSMLANH